MDDFDQMLAALPSFWQTVVWTLLALAACTALVALLIWTGRMEDV